MPVPCTIIHLLKLCVAIHHATRSGCLGRIGYAGLCFHIQPRFFFRRPLIGYDAIKGAGIHAAKAQAAGGGHFIVLIADVDVERACLFSLADLAVFAF